MSDEVRCGRCGNRHETRLQAARCEHATAALEALQDYAATLDQPAGAVAVWDAWAHLRDLTDDGENAARRVTKLLDLGWRPVIGRPAE